MCSDFPHGIISFQQQHNYPALDEAEESDSSGSHLSSESEAGEHTLCDVTHDVIALETKGDDFITMDTRNNIVRVITQNNTVHDAQTVYFDVSQNSSCNNIHDL